VESVTFELLENRRELDNLDCPVAPVPASLPAYGKMRMEDSTSPPSPRAEDPSPSPKASDYDDKSTTKSEVTFDSHLPVAGIEVEANGPCSSAHADSDLVYALKVKVKCMESLL
jgi:hypothetical protein